MLERVTLGGGLVYERGGTTGTPLVLVNALGQDLRPWAALVERLLPRRLLTWRLRGLPPDAPRAFTDHVGDLAAVLDAEGVRACHLVGWCTGPKTALSFAARSPHRVRSVVALNASTRQPGRPGELDTPYERNLEVLCRTVVRRPETAERVREMFVGGNGDDMVRDVFSTSAKLVAYARQHTEFWEQPLLPVDVPVLFVIAGQDDVVSPDAIRRAAAAFPSASCVELPGAGHHAIEEHADRVAGVIEGFTAAAEV